MEGTLSAEPRKLAPVGALSGLVENRVREETKVFYFLMILN